MENKLDFMESDLEKTWSKTKCNLMEPKCKTWWKNFIWWKANLKTWWKTKQSDEKLDTEQNWFDGKWTLKLYTNNYFKFIFHQCLIFYLFSTVCSVDLFVLSSNFWFQTPSNQVCFQLGFFSIKFWREFQTSFCNNLQITFWCGNGRAPLLHQHTVPLEQYHMVETFWWLQILTIFANFSANMKTLKSLAENFDSAIVMQTFMCIYFESGCTNKMALYCYLQPTC